MTESRYLDPEDEAFNEIERQAKQRKEAVKANFFKELARNPLNDAEQKAYERGFVAGVQKQTESAVTRMMNGGIRNDTIEEVAQHLEKMKGFGQDTIQSFATYIREMKR